MSRFAHLTDDELATLWDALTLDECGHPVTFPLPAEWAWEDSLARELHTVAEGRGLTDAAPKRWDRLTRPTRPPSP